MTTFASLYVPDELGDAVSGRAWLAAMLETERALARAGALAGVVPDEAASVIAAACDVERYDWETLLGEGRSVGNPAEPLVRALVDLVGEDAGRYVHLGATSQDVVDTAAMLVARRCLGLVLADLGRVAEATASLAREHRDTPMAGRTMLQHAVPTTFGLKAAGWLVAALDAGTRLSDVRANGLAAQLGGAAGTLAGLGDRRSTSPRASPPSSAWRRRRCPGIQTGFGSRSSARRSLWSAGSRRRSGSTSSCSRRRRSARCASRATGAAPRRCPTSGIRSMQCGRGQPRSSGGRRRPCSSGRRRRARARGGRVARGVGGDLRRARRSPGGAADAALSGLLSGSRRRLGADASESRLVERRTDRRGTRGPRARREPRPRGGPRARSRQPPPHSPGFRRRARGRPPSRP